MCLFIVQTNSDIFGNLKKLFVNDGLKGNVTYPTTLEAANLLLKGYQAVGGEMRNSNAMATYEASLAFIQPGT